MSKQELPTSTADGSTDIESRLGQVLAVIHRILPRLDEPSRSAEIQSALQRATTLLESARLSLAGAQPVHGPAPAQRVATAVEPEIAAVIAAAVSVVINRPYRLVSVQQVATPVPHLNVWALEGRTQIFQSHKVR